MGKYVSSKKATPYAKVYDLTGVMKTPFQDFDEKFYGGIFIFPRIMKRKMQRNFIVGFCGKNKQVRIMGEQIILKDSDQVFIYARNIETERVYTFNSVVTSNMLAEHKQKFVYQDEDIKFTISEQRSNQERILSVIKEIEEEF